jgi:hypothetical protein
VAPRATAMIEPTNVRIILGFTSTISSGRRKIVAPILRAMEMAYLAFWVASCEKSGISSCTG